MNYSHNQLKFLDVSVNVLNCLWDIINNSFLVQLKLAYGSVQFLRIAFDIISLYKVGKMTENKWLK